MISEKKKLVFERLNNNLNPKGFKLFKTSGDPSYVLKDQEKAVSFFFNFKQLGTIDITTIRISLFSIETIFIEIFGIDYITDKYFYDGNKYFLTTVTDKITIQAFNDEEIDNEIDLNKFIDWIINYLETNGKAFIEKYSYLPNILAEMDKLESEGLNWNHKDRGILAGSLDAYFRGLIISKLCNDPNFKNKIEKMNLKFKEDGYESWLPYYEKLKDKLTTVVPIYNV